MPDLFICYARSDIDFSRRLHARLTAAGRDVWIDWEDIPVAAIVWKEIEAALDASNTFVFVISPDSITSQMCKRELAYAARQNKRIVPVLWRNVDAAAVPMPVGAIQWLAFGENDDFEAAIARLLAALDADINQVRMHTRLLMRAAEWDQHERSPSHLLRGDDLENVDIWLAEAATGKTLHPTELQVAFIRASHQSETAELRRLKELHETGLARHLVAMSELARQQQGNLLSRNVLLAVEAIRRMPSLESDQALRAGLAILPRRLACVTHDGPLNCVAIAPSGAFFCTASRDKTAGVWNAAGKPLLRIAHEDDVNAVAVSEDARYFATACCDCSVRVWEVDGGREWCRWMATDLVRELSFSPDGNWLAFASDRTLYTGSLDGSGRIIEYLHDDQVRGLSFSPDSALVASASDDGTARVWSLAGDELLRVLHDDEVNCVAFSPTGDRLVTGSSDDTARVWDLATGDEIVRVAHTSIVSHTKFSPDGQHVASCTSYIQDRTARVWDAATGQDLIRMTHDAMVNDIAFSPDGRYVATAGHDQTGRVWELATGKEVARAVCGGPVYNVAFTADGKNMAISSFDGTGTVWETAGCRHLLRVEHDSNWTVQDIAFSPDGRYFATAGWDDTRVTEISSGNAISRTSQGRVGDGDDALAWTPDGAYLATAARDGVARVWRVTDKGSSAGPYRCLNFADLPATDRARVAGLNDICFSPDGKRLAAGGMSHTAWVCDWESGARGKGVAMAHSEQVLRVAFSPDGAKIATAAFDATAAVWDAANGERLALLRHDDPRVWSVAFSPCGHRVATASDDHTARIWDAASGVELARLTHGAGVYDVAFSPDGTTLASAASMDNAARLWRVSDGREIAKLTHEGSVYRVNFTPDGLHVATCSADRTARIWDARTGRELARLRHDDGVSRIAFSPDGRYLATVSRCHALVWFWRPEDLIAEACSRLTRNLTEDEWRENFGNEPYRKTCIESA
jgi:WD40 repeat protein